MSEVLTGIPENVKNEEKNIELTPEQEQSVEALTDRIRSLLNDYSTHKLSRNGAETRITYIESALRKELDEIDKKRQTN